MNSHRKAANQLLDTMDINTLLIGSIDSMLQLQLSNNPALLPFENIMRVFLNKHISGESLREAYIDIYVEAFTENELKITNEFYKTPTGQKMLKETPSLMAKGAKLGQQRVEDNLPELQEMIAEEANRIQKLQQDSE
ncbi:MAG: DUF2059 domain-containing protein [Desulfobacula sp.]|nr:DUF2059 domain-containing protein [Desulfobacula sp.]